jgi:hypothetical protein
VVESNDKKNKKDEQKQGKQKKQKNITSTQIHTRFEK